MGENSKIEWCDHTFNPWIGCTKVSPACDHCYAEALAKRYGRATWGPGEARARTSTANWHQPMRWERAAAKAGVRKRVFCASMADVFDAEVPDAWRLDLMQLIHATPSLDWLLLTKRPQVARKFFQHQAMPANVWLGTTVEDQKMADLRIPILLSIPAQVHFLSMEPLLGAVNVRPWLPMLTDENWPSPRKAIDWVIAGGESGRHARPSHPDWFRSLRDQCQAAGVPFFFKQWGDWHPSAMHDPSSCSFGSSHAIHISGEREFRPAEAFHKAGTEPGWAGVCRVGKARAGAQLDGREWREFPATEDGR